MVKWCIIQSKKLKVLNSMYDVFILLGIGVRKIATNLLDRFGFECIA